LFGLSERSHIVEIFHFIFLHFNSFSRKIKAPNKQTKKTKPKQQHYNLEKPEQKVTSNMEQKCSKLKRKKRIISNIP
jgi:hypothetical protein